MKTRIGVILWLRTDKPNKQGQVPLSCRVTAHGRAAELSTGIRIEPKEWNSARRKVLGTSEAARRANSSLLQMQNELESLAADLDRQGKPVTAQRLARLYRQPALAGQTLLELYEAFLAERKSLVGVEIAHATTKDSAVRYNRLKEYLQATKQTALLPEEVTYTFADKLLLWLLQERGFKRNTANKQLRGLGHVLRWGVRREYLDKNPLALYKLKGQAQAAIKFLGRGELDTLSCLELADNSLALVRDCFVFQCWTGLAYADLAALNVAASAEYATDKAGNVRRVLHITRAKSTVFKGYKCVIPLLPEAERLLAHYGDTLPVPTNQYYNRQLKELGALAGIEADKMHSHVGRKTAGTLFLNIGVPLGTVSKILGHANTLITQRIYAELLDTTVLDAFAGFGEALTVAPAPTVYALPAPQLTMLKGGAAL